MLIEQTQRSIAWGNVGSMLWWVAGLVLSIPAMNGIAALCQRPLARWFGAAGRIAAAGLQRAPARTGVTVGRHRAQLDRRHQPVVGGAQLSRVAAPI